MADNFKAILQKYLEKDLGKAQSTWHDTASNFGWDPSVINKVNVSVAGGGYSLSYADEHEQEVQDHEYGNKTSPRAAMRGFTANPETQKLIDKAVYEALSEYLVGKSGLVK